MSEYNKTILTNEGIDLARRANKGTATFSLTRGVSSTDNLSGKTVEELQNLTTLPSIQQSVILNDVVNTTDNPDTVLGIRMTFNNQNLKTGYNVHTVGIYAKEPDKNEILYGIATAKTPEYIPDFSEQTLFKFDFLMYLVIGRTDKVTVEVSPDDVYRKKDTYNKTEIDAKVSDAVSKLNNKDAEILKSLNDYKQENNTYHQNLEQQISINFDTKADKTTVEQQLGTKADKANTYTKDEVNSKVAPKADKGYVDSELNKKADKATTYTKDEINSKIAGQVKSVNGHRANSNGEVTLPKLKAKTMTSYDVKNKSATFDDNAGFDGNGNFSRWLVDQGVIGQLADAINAKLPIEEGPANTDLLMNAGNKIVYWRGNGDAVKNLPPMNNKKYFFAVKLFDTNWGSVTVIDQDGGYWINTANGNVWTGWRSVVTNEHLKKLKFVKQSLDQSGNTFQDTKFVTQEADGTFKINIFDSDWTANKVAWLLKNTSSYNIGANTNLNDIKAPGLYHCSGASNIASLPVGEDSWFNMVVNSDNWNGSQALYATNHNQLYIRTWTNSGFRGWQRIANIDEVNSRLPLGGGEMAKGSTILWQGTNAGPNIHEGNIGGLQWNGATDYVKIFGDNNASDNLDLAIQLGDDNSNHISIRNAQGAETAAIWADGHYTGTVNWDRVNGRPDINNANPAVTVINSFDVANVREGTHQTWPVKQPWLVDQMALHPFAEAINSLKGQGSYRIDYAVDVNTLTGIPNQVTVYILTNGNNRGIPIALTNPNLSDARGTLIVFNYDGNAKTQIWMPVGTSGQMGFAWRYWEGQYAPAWHTYYDTITSLGSATDSLREDMTKFQQRVDPNTPKGSFNNQTVNINDLRETGIYRFANCHIQNGPYTNDYAHWIYLKVTVFDANTVYQTLYEGDNMYGRKSSSPSDWGRWRRYLNEVI